MKKSITLGLTLFSLFIINCSVSNTSSTNPNNTNAPTGTGKAVKVYIAGESIEKRNSFIEAPFTATGALNERGGGELRNDNEEYGWMIPFADRLKLRAPGFQVEFVGSETWLSSDDNPYSGKYPASGAGKTSAISGTSIDSWLEQRSSELSAKPHCYDIAIAARGGNDFGLDNDAEIKGQLKKLINLLADGSNCRKDPVIYVTAHMPDDQRSEGQNDQEYVELQKQRFVKRFSEAVNEMKAEKPALQLRFIDMYTPFIENRKTTAFPNEQWSANGIPDFYKIGRIDDRIHPRRLASIYAGEIVADGFNLADLNR